MTPADNIVNNTAYLFRFGENKICKRTLQSKRGGSPRRFFKGKKLIENLKFSVKESHERITKVYQRLDWLESKIAEANENAGLNAVKGYYIFLPPFDNDKGEITGEQKAILDDFIKRVNAGEFIAGENIDAYASSTGSDEYNIALSQKRAENTVAYLVKKLGPEKIVPWEPTIKWKNYFKATGHGKTEKYGDEKYNRRVRLEKMIQK